MAGAYCGGLGSLVLVGQTVSCTADDPRGVASLTGMFVGLDANLDGNVQGLETLTYVSVPPTLTVSVSIPNVGTPAQVIAYPVVAGPQTLLIGCV